MSERYYLFTPPTAPEYRGTHRMFGRVAVDQGVSLLLIDGSFIQTQTPTAEQIDAADAVYYGGYVYQILSDQADALISAGYEDYIIDIVVTATAYGAGPYGKGIYGSTPVAYGEGVYGRGAYGS